MDPDMEAAAAEQIKQLEEMMAKDENFRQAMRKFGDLLRATYTKAGYKRVCQHLRIKVQ